MAILAGCSSQQSANLLQLSEIFYGCSLDGAQQGAEPNTGPNSTPFQHFSKQLSNLTQKCGAKKQSTELNCPEKTSLGNGPKVCTVSVVITIYSRLDCPETPQHGYNRMCLYGRHLLLKSAGELSENKQQNMGVNRGLVLHEPFSNTPIFFVIFNIPVAMENEPFIVNEPIYLLKRGVFPEVS